MLTSMYIRLNNQSIVLQMRVLLQQYFVHNYVKLKLGRLPWIRNHQNNIRPEVYQGLLDVLHKVQTHTNT